MWFLYTGRVTEPVRGLLLSYGFGEFDADEVILESGGDLFALSRQKLRLFRGELTESAKALERGITAEHVARLRILPGLRK